MRLLNLKIQHIEEIIDNDWLINHNTPSQPSKNQEIHCEELNLYSENGKYKVFTDERLIDLENNTSILLQNYKIKVRIKDIDDSSNNFKESFLEHNIDYTDIPPKCTIINEYNFSHQKSYNDYSALSFLYNGQALSSSLDKSFKIGQNSTYVDEETYLESVSECVPLKHQFTPHACQKHSSIFLKLVNFFKGKNYTKIQILLSFTYILALSGCSNKEIPEMQVTINAAKDLNPDVDGSFAPVVVMLFQLKQLSKFKEAGYFDLYNNAGEVLSDTYINKDEIEVRPGEKISKSLELSPLSKYIGILVAFRDFRHADWKKIYEVDENISSNFILNIKHFTIEKVS